jgi:predicted nucleic-acid-binding protein
MEQMTPLLDTNVIVRFLTSSPDDKFIGVFGFFQDIEFGKINVELKIIVLFQTIFVLKSFYKVPKDQIAKAIKKLLTLKGLKIKDKKSIVRMIDIWESNNIEIVDAYLVACLEKDSQNIIYSYDRDFDKFNINRIEP